MITTGDQVKDRISGMTGIVVSITEHLYGCRRCYVQPQEVKDGKAVEGVMFDEPQLEILQQRAIHSAFNGTEKLSNELRASGDRPDHHRKFDPVLTDED